MGVWLCSCTHCGLHRLHVPTPASQGLRVDDELDLAFSLGGMTVQPSRPIVALAGDHDAMCTTRTRAQPRQAPL